MKRRLKSYRHEGEEISDISIAKIMGHIENLARADNAFQICRPFRGRTLFGIEANLPLPDFPIRLIAHHMSKLIVVIRYQ
jgi:hypothetical protein